MPTIVTRPTSRRVPLYGWLTAECISITGTRVSMIAIPWLVLTTTGSATRTGLVAFAEMAPLVVLQALAGPAMDRLRAPPGGGTRGPLRVGGVGAVPGAHGPHGPSLPT